MKADELTVIGRKWLRARFPEADIVPEFSCAAYGGALIDLAAICEDQIVGLEIKGDGDSPSRLKLQGNMYGRVCRKIFLLPSESLLKRCQNHCPPEWDIVSTIDTKTYPQQTQCEVSGLWQPKKWRPDPRDGMGLPRGQGFGLAPAALTELIWTKEYSRFAHHLAQGELLSCPLPRKKAACLEHVLQTFPLTVVEQAACKTLLERNWQWKEGIDRAQRAA